MLYRCQFNQTITALGSAQPVSNKRRPPPRKPGPQLEEKVHALQGLQALRQLVLGELSRAVGLRGVFTGPRPNGGPGSSRRDGVGEAFELLKIRREAPSVGRCSARSPPLEVPCLGP